MNNFFAVHANKAGLIALGLLLAGFISDIQWHVFARAVGL